MGSPFVAVSLQVRPFIYSIRKAVGTSQQYPSDTRMHAAGAGATHISAGMECGLRAASRALQVYVVWVLVVSVVSRGY